MLLNCLSTIVAGKNVSSHHRTTPRHQASRKQARNDILYSQYTQYTSSGLLLHHSTVCGSGAGGGGAARAPCLFHFAPRSPCFLAAPPSSTGGASGNESSGQARMTTRSRASRSRRRAAAPQTSSNLKSTCWLVRIH